MNLSNRLHLDASLRQSHQTRMLIQKDQDNRKIYTHRPKIDAISKQVTANLKPI